MKLFRRFAVSALLLAGLYLIGHAASSYAQGKKDEKGGPKTPAKARPNWNDEQFAFEMRGKPWSTVIEWFCDKTEMPFSSTYGVPTGTFNFITPKDAKGNPRKYTLAEIYDIINESLQTQQKYTLLRRETTLTLVPADEPIPGPLVPRVKVEDLKARGKTEIVEVVVKPKRGNVDEMAPEIKRLLGDFGHVTPLTQSNQLILRADVSTLLRQMSNIIGDEEEQPDTVIHKATFVRASTLEGQIMKSLGPSAEVVEFKGGPPMASGEEPKGFFGKGGGGGGSTSTKRVRRHTVTSDDSTNTVTVHGPPDKISQAKAIIAKLDQPRFKGDTGILVGAPTIKYHDVRAGNADSLAKMLTADIFKTNSTIRISAAGPNKLFVYADPQTHYEINQIINDNAVPDPKVEVIPLVRLDATKFAETLKGMLPDSKNGSPFIEADPDTNSIRVRGTLDQVKEVRAIIKACDDSPDIINGGVVRTMMLDKGSAVTVAEALRMLFPELRPNELKIITPGSIDLKLEPRKDGSPAEPSASRGVLLIDARGAWAGTFTTNGSEIQLRFPRVATYTGRIDGKEMSGTARDESLGAWQWEVKSNDDGTEWAGTENRPGYKKLTFRFGAGGPLPAADKEAQPKRKTAPLNETKLREMVHRNINGEPTSFRDTRDTQEKQQPKSNGNGKKHPPITITAFGSRLIITSEDPDAIAAVQGLIRLLMNTEAGPGDFQVLRLKYANATEVAKLLDEAFNGPKQGGGGRGPGGGGGGPGGGLGGLNPINLIGGALGMGQQGGRTEIIRVVADPATNSLLVRAKPIDLLTIKNLLVNHIDRRDVENEARIETVVFAPLKHAAVADVAQIISQVYADSMQATPQRSNQGGQQGFTFFGGPRPVDTAGVDRKVLLHIGVDNNTNRLIVSAPRPLIEDIEKLVKQLEDGAKDSRQSVRVVSVKDIDPALVQYAIDAIQGRQTTSRQTSPTSSFNNFPSSSGFQGFRTPGSGFQGFQGQGPGSSGMPTFIMPNFQGPGGGQSFTPGGGGGTPGIRTFTPGGGGGTPTFRPGGGGGGGPRGRVSRGPDFFVSRVTDDPEASPFYDPSEEQELPAVPHWDGYVKTGYTINPFTFTGFQGEFVQDKLPPKELQPDPKGKDQNIDAPRLPVQIEALPDLGALILRANNQADLEAALQIIEILRRTAVPSQVEIKIIPLRFGDPNSVTNILNQLLSRVNLGPNVVNIVAGPRGTTVAPQPTQPITPTVPGQPTTPTPQQQQQAAGGPTNIILIPLTRFGSIMVAASKARMPDIEKLVRDLDQLPSDVHGAVPFRLKNATAARVATAINNFYAQRFPAPEVNQIRITYDDGTNTVFVQASPADLKEISNLILHFDSAAENMATNELRVVRLRNAVALDLAQLLQVAISNNALVMPPTIQLPGQPQQTPGGVQPGAGQLTQIFGQQTPMTKDFRLRLVVPGQKDKEGKPIESQVLQDIRINPYIQNNALLVSAPEKTMPLLLALINDLDTPPQARSHVTVFNLKRADALLMQNLLRTLFVGTGGLGTQTTTQGQAGGGLPAAGGTGQQRPLTITISNTTPEGAPIIDLRVTADERTNSLVVAGSRNDLDVVEAIIARIEDAEFPTRTSIAVRLRNANALDIANTLTTFINSYNTLFTTNDPTQFFNLQRPIVVTGEPISNSLLINATPDQLDRLIPIISQLDTTPPQVVIQVLIAEVTLNGSEEFGMEFGLQSPLLLQRSGVGGNGVFSSVAYQTISPATQFLATNANQNPADGLLRPGVVGFQQVTNLGTGRISPTSGIGGLVFTAASDSVNVLVRALKIQNRLNVLSRPQVMTLDKQVAYINVGKNIPIISGFNTNATTGVLTPITDRLDTGVSLQVTPTITPDGRVLMRVIPNVSSLAEQIPFGNGFSSPAINQQHLETTVSANDAETVVLGGLITKRDEKNENKIPWVGDLPIVGAAFRFRTHSRIKSELVIILTPHIVRNRFEADRILAEETRRIDWSLGDVMRVHGTANCATFAPPPIPDFNGHGKNQPQRQPDGPQVIPAEHLPMRQPIGKGGLLKSVFGKRGETSTVSEYTTTVEYSAPPKQTGLPMPEVIMMTPRKTEETSKPANPTNPTNSTESPSVPSSGPQITLPQVPTTPSSLPAPNGPARIVPVSNGNVVPGSQGRETMPWIAPPPR